MASLSSLLVSFLLLFPALSIAADSTAKCYNLKGEALDSTYTPCKSTSGSAHSGCCATNRTSGPEICLDSGLCMATAADKGMGTMWQNACTDSTWKDGGCPRKMCPTTNDDFDDVNPIANWNIQSCAFGSFCCRGSTDPSTSCCNNGTAPKFKAASLGNLQFPVTTVTLPVSSSTSTSTASPSSSSSAPLTTESPAASTLDPSTLCKKEKDRVAVVGGAIGCTLGAALVGMLALVLWLHKKEKRQRKLKDHYEAQFSKFGGGMLHTRDVVTPSEKEAEVTYLGYHGRGD